MIKSPTLWKSTLLLSWLAFSGAHLRADEVLRRMQVFDLRFLEPPVSEIGALPMPPKLRGFPSDAAMRHLAEEVISFADDSDGNGHRGPSLSLPQVEEAVRMLVARDSWSNVRNRLAGRDGRLVVVHTPEVLAGIARFVDALGARCSRLVSVELALVPPSALDSARREWRSSPWLEGEFLDRALEAAGDQGRFLSALGREGTWIRLTPTVLSRHLLDLEVNQTGVVPVVSPVVDSVPGGAFGEAMVLPSPAGDWSRVDLRLGATRTRGESERERLDSGDLELIRQDSEQVGTTVAVPGGRTMLLGLFDTPGRGRRPGSARRDLRFAGLIRVRRIEAAPRGAEAGEGPHLVDAGLFLEPLPDYSIAAGDHWNGGGIGTGGRGERRPGLLRAAVLEDVVRGLFPAERPGRYLLAGGTLLLGASAEEAPRVRERLERLARERTRLVQIELQQLSLDEGELEGAGTKGALVDSAWLEAKRDKAQLSCRLIGLNGANLALASVSSRSYIAGIEHVSGGTDVRVAEVADIVTATVGEGLVLTARAEVVPGTDWVQLRLKGEIARSPLFGRRARIRSDLRVATEAASEGKPVATPQASWIEVDLPEEDTDRWEHMVTLPVGRSMLLSVLPDRSQPGKVRVLIGAVRSFEVESTAPTRTSL